MTLITQFDALEKTVDTLIQQLKQSEFSQAHLKKQLSDSLKAQHTLEQKNEQALSELKRLARALEERLL